MYSDKYKHWIGALKKKKSDCNRSAEKINKHLDWNHFLKSVRVWGDWHFSFADFPAWIFIGSTGRVEICLLKLSLGLLLGLLCGEAAPRRADAWTGLEGRILLFYLADTLKNKNGIAFPEQNKTEQQKRNLMSKITILLILMDRKYFGFLR